MTNVELLDPIVRFDQNVDGVFIRKQQHITDDLLKQCSDLRLASAHERAGEYHHCAAIPTGVVEKWLREGFDVNREPVKAILARLRAENLDAFITTNKV